MWCGVSIYCRTTEKAALVGALSDGAAGRNVGKLETVWDRLAVLGIVFVRCFLGLRIAPNGGQILAQALTWQTIGCSPRKFLNPDSTQCFMYSLHFTYCCNDVTLNNIYPYCNSWTSIVCLSLLAQLADQGCHFWRKSPIRRHFWRNSDRKASLLAQIADIPIGKRHFSPQDELRETASKWSDDRMVRCQTSFTSLAMWWLSSFRGNLGRRNMA